MQLLSFLEKSSTGYYVATVLLTLILSYITWFLFYRPWSKFYDVTKHGFDNILNSKNYKSDESKKQIINDMLKWRKSGKIPNPYPVGWYAILESDELPRKSSKEVFAFGKNFAVWRGESGKCYCSDAYCPHLGANLGCGGKVKKECIKCPFHGWTFNGMNGSLVNVPYSDHAPNNVNIKLYSLVEHDGFIYFWNHPENIKPTFSTEPIPELASTGYRYRGRLEFRAAIHVQDVCENAADAGHFKYLHAPSFLQGTDPSTDSWSFLKQVWTINWSVVENKSHLALMIANGKFVLFNKYVLFTFTMETLQVGPGIGQMRLTTPFGNIIVIHTALPLQPMLQKSVYRCYTEPKFVHPLAIFYLNVLAVEYGRDISIWCRKTFLEKPILTSDCGPIKPFRRWFAQFDTTNDRQTLASEPLNKLEF